jgi:hypothetical protein
MPPHKHILDVFWISTEITCKLVTEFVEFGSRQRWQIIENIGFLSEKIKERSEPSVMSMVYLLSLALWWSVSVLIGILLVWY